MKKKNSINEGLFVIEGENLVEEAIKNNLLSELYILDGVENRFDFECNYLTSDVMKSISNLSSTSRVIGVSKYINKNKLGKRVVLLDDIFSELDEARQKHLINNFKNYQMIITSTAVPEEMKIDKKL